MKTGIRRRSGSTFATRRSERWIDERGREFRPYTHYNVGGNTKFWGSVLYRLRRKDFRRRSSTWTASRPGGRSTTTRSNPTTTAPSASITCMASSASDPTEPERGDVSPRRRFHTPTGCRRSSGSFARRDFTLPRCRSAFATAASSATRATRSPARCTRRARPRCAACARRWRSRTSSSGRTPARSGC